MNIFENHFHLHKLLHDEMSKIYIYQAILTFSKSMIGIYVPIYLFKLGFSIIQVLFYSIGVSLVYLLIIPLATKIISRIGFKKTILLTTPIYLIHLISLNFLEYQIFYYFSFITYGIYAGIFWPTMHCEIAFSSNKKHGASQLGTLQIIIILFSTISPLIGGYFLENLSYWKLLIFISIIISLGTLPLLLANDIKIKRYLFNYQDYFKLFHFKKLNKSKIAFSSEGVTVILNTVIWPILLYLLLSKNFLKLGILFSIISFVSVFLLLYIKNYIDSNKNKYLNLTVKFLSFSWFLKFLIFFFGSIFIYFVELLYKLIINIFNVSYFSIFYSNAKKIGYFDYIILRELYLHITKIFISLFLFIPFLYFIGFSINSLFFLILFGVFFSFGLSFLEEIY